MTARDCVVFPGLPGSLILAGRQRGAATLLLEAPPALWRHLQPSWTLRTNNGKFINPFTSCSQRLGLLRGSATLPVWSPLKKPRPANGDFLPEALTTSSPLGGPGFHPGSWRVTIFHLFAALCSLNPSFGNEAKSNAWFADRGCFAGTMHFVYSSWNTKTEAWEHFRGYSLCLIHVEGSYKAFWFLPQFCSLILSLG